MKVTGCGRGFRPTVILSASGLSGCNGVSAARFIVNSLDFMTHLASRLIAPETLAAADQSWPQRLRENPRSASSDAVRPSLDR